MSVGEAHVEPNPVDDAVQFRDGASKQHASEDGFLNVGEVSEDSLEHGHVPQPAPAPAADVTERRSADVTPRRSTPAVKVVVSCVLCGLRVGALREKVECGKCARPLCKHCGLPDFFAALPSERKARIDDPESPRSIATRAMGYYCGECPGTRGVKMAEESGILFVNPSSASFGSPGGAPRPSYGSPDQNGRHSHASASPQQPSPDTGRTRCFICRSTYGVFTWRAQCADCRRYCCDSCVKKVRVPPANATTQVCPQCLPRVRQRTHDQSASMARSSEGAASIDRKDRLSLSPRKFLSKLTSPPMSPTRKEAAMEGEDDASFAKRLQDKINGIKR